MNNEELKVISLNSGMPERFFIDKWDFPKPHHLALVDHHVIDPYIKGVPVSLLFTDCLSNIYDSAFQLSCVTIWKMAKKGLFKRDYFIFPVNELIFQPENYFYYESAMHTDFSNKAANCDLLFLYDFGTTYIPPKQCSLLFSILRSRYNGGKSTIISSSRPAAEHEKNIENALTIFIREYFLSIEVE